MASRKRNLFSHSSGSVGRTAFCLKAPSVPRLFQLLVTSGIPCACITTISASGFARPSPLCVCLTSLSLIRTVVIRFPAHLEILNYTCKDTPSPHSHRFCDISFGGPPFNPLQCSSFRSTRRRGMNKGFHIKNYSSYFTPHSLHNSFPSLLLSN